jgi:hypothetical protein
MKQSTELLEGVASLKGSKQGRVLLKYLEDLLSQYNRTAANELKLVPKLLMSGRIQQLYDLIDLFNNAVEKLDKRKTTK